MSLKEKAARIDLSQVGRSNSQNPPKPAGKTAIGMHAEALYRDEKIVEENQQLKQQLIVFNDSLPAKLLNPTKIHPTKWANRSEQSYVLKEFFDLKEEIRLTGGNVQAIKVRPCDTRPGEYELVFGHRRHRSCLDLGLPVLAVIEDMSDVELFAQMDRENRQRADLRPYEQGVMYARALDEGLYVSLRKMADALGVEAGNVSKAVSLARLPKEILYAFLTPLDLQQNWAPVLTQALQKNPEYVLTKAKVLSETTPRPKAGEILKMLTQNGDGALDAPPKGAPSIVQGKSGQSGAIIFDEKRKTFSITLAGVDASRSKEVEALVKTFLS